MLKKCLPILLILVLLAGCSRVDFGIISGADATEPDVLKTEPVIVPPDEAAVRNAFDKAVEVYGWFDLCTMDLDYEEAVTQGERVFYPVLDEDVKTYEDLRTLVYNLFDTATGDKLLSESEQYEHYKDINGVLYAQDAARGADITKGEYTYTVEVESTKSVVCHVSIENIELSNTAENHRVVTGYTDYDFHYQYVNGRWVFTDFELFF